MRDDQIALQLYTVRREAAADLLGTLRAVADAGYTAVELAGLPEVATGELARLLDDAGLRVAASHEPLEALRRDADAVANRLLALSCRRVVVPWLAPEERGTPDAVRAVARELATIERRLSDRGLRLGYHNHDFEFAPIDGTTAWDVLLEELPPAVEIEVDVYWVAFAGRDPAATITAAGDRVRLLHMKDLAPRPDRRDAPPGEGLLAWDAILDAADGTGVEWFVVEQDEPADPFADIARGHRFLAGRATAAAAGGGS